MAKRPQMWSVVATSIVAGLGATAAPAAEPEVVGGTVELAQPGSEPSTVVTRGRAAAVALLPGRPVMAAVGEPGADHASGRVRLVQFAAGRIATTSRSVIAGPGRGSRAGVALASVRRAFGRRNAALLIGAARMKWRSRGRPGAAFLVADPARTRRLRVGDSDVVTIIGARDGDRAGAAVAAVADADGDKRPEVLLGTPGADVNGRPGAGAAYVVFSRRMRLGGTVDLADRNAALRVAGPAAGARAGSAVAGSVDLNGDRRGDVIVGAPGLREGSGAAYVIHLASGQPVDLADADAPALVLMGSDGARAGTALAAPRDLNGDGLREIAVGAPRAHVEGRGVPGAVYVVTPGAAEGAVSLAGFGERMEGEADGDRAGSDLAAAGHASGGDGSDLLVGARLADPLGRHSAGAAYLVTGRAAASGIDLASLGPRGIRLVGESPGALAGAALAGGVDLNQDTHDDILMTAVSPTSDGRATPSVLLQAVPALPRRAKAKPTDKCDARPLSMVVDTSLGLFEEDRMRLRGSALKLLLAQPSSDERVIGAVEAAPMPAEAFLPLIPGRLRSPEGAAILEDLVDEAVQRATGPGDLREALDVAIRRLPARRTRSAIVVAGPDAVWTPGAPPDLRTDVISVGVTPGSPQETMLRGLATASGGEYERVGVNKLQAQVAEIDAERRCETLVHETDGRRITLPKRSSTLGATRPTGADFHDSALVDELRGYADLVLSWTSSAVTIEPYEVTVTDVVSHITTTFGPAQVEAAIRGTEVMDSAHRITLIGGASETSSALRVGFEHEHEHAGRARAAHHHPHRVGVDGGGEPAHGADAATSVLLYTQFFEPPAHR